MSEPKNHKTASGVEVKECYSAEDLPKDLASGLGAPGSYPFTRGIRKNMYRGRLWTMRQYAGFGTAREANQRYQYLLKQGTTGLSVAFDLPTQMGHDSDSAIAKGEVGRVGVAISSVEDLHILFDGIKLEEVSISMTINSTAAILLAFLLVVAEERKVEWSKLKGTIQNDVLKEYVARGTYIFPPRPALRLITDIFGYCASNVPHWNTISISGYHIREAGSTAPEELAFTFSDGIAYVESALKAGLKIDDFAPRLAFFFNCHLDFFEEIAKFRAARRIWAKIMRERFGAKNPESWALRFHTQTAGSSLTAQQPLNNIVRTTVEAMAAVLGGTQSLHTNSFDEALGLPTEQSAQIALRTQQILAYETGIANTVDPLAGSYYVENLTAQIESESMRRIEYIDSLGGMIRAIEQGYPQSEIERSAYNWQKEIEGKERIIVGVNKFEVEENVAPNLLRIDPSSELEQNTRLSEMRTKRDAQACAVAIEAIAKIARTDENLMPHIVEAARRRVTLGEISNALRGVFGEFE